MSVKLLCLCLLLVLLCPSWAKKHTCLTSASNCEECIQSGPMCAWCSSAQGSNVRCHTSRGLKNAGCHKNDIYNPQGRVQVVKNDSSTEQANIKTLFLQPQELSLHLRPGVSQSFPLTINMPADQPLTELTVDISPVPAGVNITLTSVVNENPVVIQVTVEAAECPSESADSNQNQNTTGPWSVQITPQGFSLSVKLEITLDCQCDCKKIPEEHSPACNGHGTHVCGRCMCYNDYEGQQCERNFFERGDEYCRQGPNDPLCSGRGKCVEGDCECEKRANPEERYSGMFCQCSNFDCPYSNGSICGGHGRCECGNCICDAKWTAEDCSCSLDTASCMASNGQICNGRGSCECGICRCTSQRFMGPTCENCPVCPGVCTEHRECAECRAFGTGAKKDRCDQECGYFNFVKVKTRDDFDVSGEIAAYCKERTEDDCFFFYTYSISSSGKKVTVAETKLCQTSSYWG